MTQHLIVDAVMYREQALRTLSQIEGESRQRQHAAVSDAHAEAARRLAEARG